MRWNAALLITIAMVGPFAGKSALAQNGPYHPGYPLLDHRQMPVGQAGQWMQQAGEIPFGTIQPVRFEIETGGRIAVFQGSAERTAELVSPAVVGVAVGPVYRLRLHSLDQFPQGTEVYPTVELIDRLHPPPGRETEFPIEIRFTREEIELALEGRLVTKVIYLEQPQIIPPRQVDDPDRITRLGPHENLLQAADQMGRPMAIVRLGGRQPTLHGEDARFFGNGPVVKVAEPDASE